MSATDDLRTAGDRSTALSPPAPDIASTASRIGAYAWWTARLFEVVGGWVVSTPDPAAKVFFAESAGRFAEQAGEWYERLPRLREAPRAELVQDPGPSASSVADALAQLGDRDERIAGLRAVIARLDEVLADHEGALAAVRDGSTALTLRRARTDLADLLRASEPLVAPVTVGTTSAGSGRIDRHTGRFSVTGPALFS